MTLVFPSPPIPRPRTPEPGAPTRWDALELPAEAGYAVLARPGVHTGPALLTGAGTMLLLVPEGSAEELPGLLEWLEWDGVELELRAHGPFRSVAADGGPDSLRGAVPYWIRPPEQGHAPAAPPAGAGLARLVGVAATECHRARLARSTRPQGQAVAFS